MARLDKGVATDGEDDDVGSAAFAASLGRGDHIFFPSMDGVREAVGGGDGVTFRVKVGSKYLGSRSSGKRGEQDADGSLTDHQHRFVGRDGKILDRLAGRY